jgi:hypothetical protein
VVGGALLDIIDEMKRRAATQDPGGKFEPAADDLKRNRAERQFRQSKMSINGQSPEKKFGNPLLLW